MFKIATNETSGLPKYKQIVNAVVEAIGKNELQIGDRIPSVNELSEMTGFAKKTVVQALDQLKETGLISSVKYKGFYVASTNTQQEHHIFLLFNQLTAYKEEMYESMKKQLGDKGTVDIFFHHNNVEVFEMLIEQSVGNYTDYIIMPIGDPAIGDSLKKLPEDKTYIIDLGYKEWGQKFPSVCQYFEEDIYEVLSGALEKVKKYNNLILVVGESLYNIKYTVSGFKRFCKENHFDSKIIYHARRSEPAKGELFIIVDDSDLIRVVKKAQALSLTIGSDIGIISFNEIPFKEIAVNGIATISTDFERMGKDIIRLVLEKRTDHLRNPCRLVERSSF